jgi:hypothetical protein
MKDQLTGIRRGRIGDSVLIHELSTANGHSLRFKYSATTEIHDDLVTPGSSAD